MANKHIIPGLIDDLLKQRGMTQKDFCASTKPHIDPATFKKAREGGPVQHGIAKRIADGFRIPIDKLIATVEDGEPSTPDGLSSDRPYAFDEPRNHPGQCSIEPCTLMKPGDAVRISLCEKIRWRLVLDELSDEQENALKALQYEIFAHGQARERGLVQGDVEEDSLDFQISSIRSTEKAEEILDDLKRLKISVRQLRYQVWSCEGYEDYYDWISYRSVDHAAVLVSESRKSIRLFEVYVGERPPEDRSQYDKGIAINGRGFDIPIRPDPTDLDSEIPF